MSCNRRGPHNIKPTVVCENVEYNVIQYNITNASKAWWTQSSDPTVRNEITLTDGEAFDELVLDSGDNYRICATNCGCTTCCNAVCGEFNYSFNVIDNYCECLDENRLREIDFFEYEITIPTGNFTPTAPAWLVGCSVACPDANGTYVLGCRDSLVRINKWRFLCTRTDDLGRNLDFFAVIELTFGWPPADSFAVQIAHSVAGFTRGFTPPNTGLITAGAGYIRRIQYNLRQITVNRALVQFYDCRGVGPYSAYDCSVFSLNAPSLITSNGGVGCAPTVTLSDIIYA